MNLTPEAEARAVRENEPLVLYALRRFSDRPDFDDLLQLGRIGLLIAIRKYDPTRGAKFSTMAVPWIYSLAARKRIDENRVKRIADRTAISLDTRRGTPEDPGDSLADMIPDPHSSDVFDQAEARTTVEKYLSILSRRETDILQSIARGESVARIARRYGISKPRIYIIRDTAIQKIRDFFWRDFRN